jgi:chromosome segregation ATPase
MLKTEIRRLYEDRKESNKAKLTDERSSQALERKYILAREMVDKLKTERSELQRTCFELKTKADEMERRFYDAQMQAKRLAEKAGRTVGEISLRLSGNGGNHGNASTRDGSPSPNQGPSALGTLAPLKLPPPVWASLATTPGGSRNPTEPPGTENGDQMSLSSGRNSKSNQDDLPDFEAWRLKIESLTSERAFLVNENTLLKDRVNELSNKIGKLEKIVGDMQGRLRNTDKDIRNAQQQAKVAAAKYSRAEKVAASIEKQFRVSFSLQLSLSLLLLFFFFLLESSYNHLVA